MQPLLHKMDENEDSAPPDDVEVEIEDGANNVPGEEEENYEGDATKEQRCFKLLIDKTLGGEVKLMEWCPTMDLLAIITIQNELAVHRLSWQRIFLIKPHQSDVTALTWRPDGTSVSPSSTGLLLTLLCRQSVSRWI